MGATLISMGLAYAVVIIGIVTGQSGFYALAFCMGLFEIAFAIRDIKGKAD